jgi:hypothetical protein
MAIDAKPNQWGAGPAAPQQLVGWVFGYVG